LGVEPDRTVQPQHHHFHFNQLGGAIMLDRIVERLRSRRLSSQTALSAAR